MKWYLNGKEVSVRGIPEEYRTLYDIVGLPFYADPKTVEAAYAKFQQNFKQLSPEAYDDQLHCFMILRAPATRQKYDTGNGETDLIGMLRTKHQLGILPTEYAQLKAEECMKDVALSIDERRMGLSKNTPKSNTFLLNLVNSSDEELNRILKNQSPESLKKIMTDISSFNVIPENSVRKVRDAIAIINSEKISPQEPQSVTIAQSFAATYSSDTRTHYEILGLPVNVDQDTIDKTYQEYDRAVGHMSNAKAAETLGLSLEEYNLHISAFRILLFPDARNSYDENQLISQLKTKFEHGQLPIQYAQLKAEESMLDKSITVEYRRLGRSKNTPRANIFLEELIKLANPSAHDFIQAREDLIKKLRMQDLESLKQMESDIRNFSSIPTDSRNLLLNIIQNEKILFQNTSKVITTFEENVLGIEKKYQSLIGNLPKADQAKITSTLHSLEDRLEELQTGEKAEPFDLRTFIRKTNALSQAMLNLDAEILEAANNSKNEELIKQAKENSSNTKYFLAETLAKYAEHTRTHYEILDLPVNIDQQSIDEAYTRFQQVVRNQSSQDAANTLGITLEKYDQLVTAYYFLSDKSRRNDYDNTELVELLEFKHQTIKYPPDYAQLKAEECMKNSSDIDGRHVTIEEKRREKSKSPEADKFFNHLIELASHSSIYSQQTGESNLKEALRSQSSESLRKIAAEIGEKSNNKLFEPIMLNSLDTLLSAIKDEQGNRGRVMSNVENQIQSLLKEYNNLIDIKSSLPEGGRLSPAMEERLRQLRDITNKYEVLEKELNAGYPDLQSIGIRAIRFEHDINILHPTHYDILGLTVNADQEIIMEAFANFPKVSDSRNEEDCAKLLGINVAIYRQQVEAFNTLIDSRKREEYDDKALIELLESKHSVMGFPSDYAQLKAEECMINRRDNDNNYIAVEDRRKEMSNSPEANKFFDHLLKLPNLDLEQKLRNQSSESLKKIREEISTKIPKDKQSKWSEIYNAVVNEQEKRKSVIELLDKEMASLKREYDDLWALTINPPQDEKFLRVLQEKEKRLQELKTVVNKYEALKNAVNAGNADLEKIKEEIEKLKSDSKNLSTSKVSMTDTDIKQYQTHYDVLDLPANASQEVIESSYKQFLRVIPGRDEKACAALLGIIEVDYKRRAEAFTILMNPQSRDEYDNTTLVWLLRIKHHLLEKAPTDYSELKAEECMINKTDSNGRIIPVTHRRAGISQSPKSDNFFQELLRLASPDPINNQEARRIILANSLKSQYSESLKLIKGKINEMDGLDVEILNYITTAIDDQLSRRQSVIKLIAEEMPSLKREYDDLWDKMHPLKGEEMAVNIREMEKRWQQLKPVITMYESLLNDVNTGKADLEKVKGKIEELNREIKQLMSEKQETMILHQEAASSGQTLYDIVGLPVNVEQAIIYHAFDKFPKVGVGRTETDCAKLLGITEEKYMQQVAAFKILTNEATRDEYDNTKLIDILELRHRNMKSFDNVDYAQLESEECMKSRTDIRGKDISIADRRQGVSRCRTLMTSAFHENLLKLADILPGDDKGTQTELEKILKNQSPESLQKIMSDIIEYRQYEFEKGNKPSIAALKLLSFIKQEREHRQLYDELNKTIAPLKTEYDDLLKLKASLPREGEFIREKEERWQQLCAIIKKFEALEKEVKVGNQNPETIGRDIKQLKGEIDKYLTPKEAKPTSQQQLHTTLHQAKHG